MNETDTNDLVNHPKHYTSSKSGIEVIEVTRYLTGSLSNAWKYCCRYTMKGTPKQDLKKAIFYLNDFFNHFPKPEHYFTCDANYCLYTLLPNMKAFIEVEEAGPVAEVLTVIRKIIAGELIGELILRESEFEDAIQALDKYADSLGD